MKTKYILVAVFAMVLYALAASGGYAAEVVDVVTVDPVPGPVYDKNGAVSLDFENADLKNVLKAFSMQTGINFIASDVIENKKITVFLSNVSIESALMSILEANGLLYEKQPGNVYLIKPTGKGNIRTLTKIYKLNYLQVYKMTRDVGAAGSTSNITIIGQPAIAEAGSTSSSMANAPTTGQSTGTDNQVKNIIDIIRSLMSKYGTIVADRRNNCLIITDIPDVFETVEATIKKLDVEPIQVVIQAQIIETTTSALKRLGLEYGSETQLFKVTYTGSSSTTGGLESASNPSFPTAFPFTENFIKDTYGGSLLNNAAFSYGTLKIDDAEIVLKMLSLDSDTKYLSRPRIMTINNEPAIIKVSANTAIGTNNTSVSQTAQNITTAERAETGVILKVTPQVNAKGDIFMFIEPSVSRAVQSTLSTSFMDPSYRTSANTVMVRNLETVVVAGLIQTNNYKTVRKIPILADIPIIGEPFKSRYKKVEDTELLIFITPRIVKRFDPEFITPPNMDERDYMVEKALEHHIEEAAEKEAIAIQRAALKSKKAAPKREAVINKSLKKHFAETNISTKERSK